MEFSGYGVDDRIFLLMLATYAAVIIGGPRWLHNLAFYNIPATLWRNIVVSLESKLNRRHRKLEDRRVRGNIVLAILLFLTVASASLVTLFTITMDWGWYIEVSILTYLLPIRACILPALEIKKHIKHKRLSHVNDALQPLTDMDVEHIDLHTQIRATMAYIARCLPLYIITPTCWYLLLGLPGLMTARLLTCMYELWPASHKKYRAFSVSTRWWHTVIHSIPTRISFIFQWFALLFVPQCSLRSGLQSLIKQPAEPAINTNNLSLRLCAYGLGFSLGGPYVANGQRQAHGWIGHGSARLEQSDLTRGLIWYGCASGIWLLFISTLFLITS